MILDCPDKFPNLAGVPLVVDIESTSFDDTQEALKPFNGHRVCGYAFGPLKGEETFYLPLRHRHGGNCNFDSGVKYMQDILAKSPHIVNHNIKFDIKFWRQDGCIDTGKLSDTMVLGRFIINDLFSYSLDTLGGLFLKEKKIDSVKIYVAKHGSKDYGICPIELMAPYAEKDVDLTRRLYHKLMAMLPPESLECWKTEEKLTRLLVEQEMRGVCIDKPALLKASRATILSLIDVHERINEYAGQEIDPGSAAGKKLVLSDMAKLTPATQTPTGKPQWNADNLELLHHPVAAMFQEYAEYSHFNSNFCEGFRTRLGDDGKMHTDFQSGGTKSGRLSCRNPNLQNLSPAAAAFFLPNPGEAIITFDYSQIEYRIFGHYTQDAQIMGKYLSDPKTDFHQFLADMLGISRQIAKTINFGMLYGMGKKKLLATITKLILADANPATLETMKILTFGDGPVPDSEELMLSMISSKVYNNYHLAVPAIKMLRHRVDNKVRVSQQVRNYFGRVYRFGSGENSGAHRAVNYLCQGTAADLFKNRLVSLHDRFPELHLLTNVHDAGYWSMPEDWIIENAAEMKAIMEHMENPFRVPIRVDGKCGRLNMAKLKSFDSVADIQTAMAESEREAP